MARSSSKPAPSTETTKARITVLASPEQAEILTRSATESGVDRSSWMLAHSLKAAALDKDLGAPLVLSGETSERVRALATKQGVRPEELIKQLLITA